MKLEVPANKEITLKLRASTVQVLIRAAQQIDPSGIFFTEQLENIKRQMQEQLDTPVGNPADETNDDFTRP